MAAPQRQNTLRALRHCVQVCIACTHAVAFMDCAARLCSLSGNSFCLVWLQPQALSLTPFSLRLGFPDVHMKCTLHIYRYTSWLTLESVDAVLFCLLTDSFPCMHPMRLPPPPSLIGCGVVILLILRNQRACMRKKDWRCHKRVTPARSPWRAHVACIPCLRQRQSFSRMLLSQK